MDLVRKKPIEENRITEKEYRKMERLSYSSVKLYDNDRRRFYTEFVLGERKIEKKSPSLIIGSLVHCLLAGGETYREKFHEAQCKPPVGQMLELCEELFTRSLKSMNSDGIQQDSFSVIFSDAFNTVKYDYNGDKVKFKNKTIEQVLEAFVDKDPELYYKELIENYDRTTVTMSMVENAEKLVNKLKSHTFTQEYVNDCEEEGMVVYNELPILYSLNGVDLKSMPDKMVVDSNKRVISLYDYKTSYDNESPEKAYTKYGYYIQAYMYYIAAEKWAIENGMSDYIIEPMVFIFIDTQGFNAPVILKLSKDDIDRAGRGFKLRGILYPGALQLLESIAWNIGTGDWTSTKQIADKQGVVQLRLDYGSR